MFSKQNHGLLNLIIISLNKESILNIKNKAHALTATSAGTVGRVEVRNAELHIVSVIAIVVVVRSRPVEADGTDSTADRSPFAVARSRKEDCPDLLQCTPLWGGQSVAAETSIGCVGVAQAVSAAAPIIRQQDYTVNTVHICHGIADTRSSTSCIEHIVPFGIS